MAVLLDTRDLPTRQRTRAFLSAMVDATVPSYAVLERPDIDLHARFEMWELGDGAVLRCRSNTGIRLYRTPAQALRTMPPVISLSIQERAAARQEQFGHQRVLPPGELACTDLTAPYDYAWAGPGAGRALQVPVDQLGLPMDAVRRAGANLTTSPVYGLVRNHIAEVTGLAAARAGPAAPALAAASLELVRALLASACHQESGHARAVLADTLVSQVHAHVRQHLVDADLRPESIAAALNVSVRYLYRVCSRAGFSLEQWIISQRLEGARTELSGVSGRQRTVAVVARRWGFADPAHFSRRFRNAYGITPGEWRRLAGADVC